MRALAALLVLVLLAGCGSGNGARTTDSDPDVIEGDDIQRRDLQRIEAMLRGQIAGVDVRQVGGSWTIEIRGTSSFSGNDDPLFVIDGYPIPLGTEGALNGINPRDVESIRVLKNASDTAMYGSRGANGVILITTVRPPRPSESESR